MDWLKRAAQQEDVEGMFNLGIAHLKGEGTERSPEDGALWLQKAAERGHADAQFRLAMCFANGEGVSENPEGVERWLLKAVKQGHKQAKVALDKAREAGILRPKIPPSNVINAPKEEGKRPADLEKPEMGTTAYGKGVKKDQICSQAEDKAACFHTAGEYQQAFEHTKKDAESGNAKAQES